MITEARRIWLEGNKERVKKIKRKWNRNNVGYFSEWRFKNKERLLQRRIRNRNFINEYLKANHCIDCGESDFRCLDFDHVNGDKKYSLGNMKNCGFGLDTIQKEIEKCVIRCSNCHRRKHYLDKNGSIDIS